jgi:hypothetical protein
MIGLEKTKTVVRMFKTVSDGTHANTRGFHGSLTAHSLQKIFHEIDPYGRNFLDFGFGTGVVLAAALASGASKVHGFELPGNEANQYIFQATMRLIPSKFCPIPEFSGRSNLEFNDIVEVMLGNRCNHGWFLRIIPFLNSTGEFAARKNRGSILILERDGFPDPNSHS